MASNGYVLVTSADEKTWDSEVTMLFLGEWCKLYSRRDLWSTLSHETVPPIFSTQNEKNEVFNKLQPIIENLTSDLASQLNAIHGINYTQRSWEIILGHWVTRFVQVIYHRYSLIEYAFDNYEIKYGKFYKGTNYSLVTTTSTGFIHSMNDNKWNSQLFYKIINFLKYNLEVDFIQLEVKEDIHLEKTKFNFKKYFKKVYSRLAERFVKKNDAFILRSYLPGIQELKLQLSLFQIPIQWEVPVPEKNIVNAKLRDSLSLDSEKYTGFEEFIRLYVKEFLPTVYLEGFSKCLQIAKGLPWPSSPKFIFTSNAFDTDEIFKIWTAEKVEKGIPYFTGQHGNNYGTHFATRDRFAPETITADYFFSWGWAGPKVVPAFNFKIANKLVENYDKSGGLLLIEITCQELYRPWDDYAKHAEYQADQFKFVELLSLNIKKMVTVRLMRLYLKNNWFDDLRWSQVLPDIALEKGLERMNDLIGNSRLIVHSYDSTGILETLALNIPTMCFWQGGLGHLTPEAQKFYQLLVDAKILALSPEILANNVNEFWNDIDAWWLSEKVQNARILFCKQYSRKEMNPVFKLRKLLLETTHLVRAQNLKQ
jgi:putative transferase (TIGR04331 family)